MNLVCNCGVALFHFVLSYLPLASNPSQRERTTLDSWLRLVARGFIRWSTFQKLKTKIFLRKNRYIGAQPIREIHLQREQKTAEAWRIRRKNRRYLKKYPEEGNLEWENGFEYFNFSIKSWRTEWNEGKFRNFLSKNFQYHHQGSTGRHWKGDFEWFFRFQKRLNDIRLVI